MEITSQSVMSCDLSFPRIHSSLERLQLTSKIHTRISLMIGPVTAEAAGLSADEECEADCGI